MKMIGADILVKVLKGKGVDTMFYIMGGPMFAVQLGCIHENIRSVDVRHEQAAAMMAQAYSRVTNRPGVCIAASGPGTINFVTGVANAFVDCAPMIVIGGSSPVSNYNMGTFQEIDQVAIMRPITKWSERVYEAKRIPEYLDIAFRIASSGRPGPVYLDFPGDVLYEEVDESEVVWHNDTKSNYKVRTLGDPELIQSAISLLSESEKPIIVSGSGTLWSDAASELQSFVELTGIPFYTTPQGRGVIPEDHNRSFLHARSTAFREADLVFFIGTRLNYVVGYGQTPRFSEHAKVIQIDIDPIEIGHNRTVDVGIVGDAKAVLQQLIEAGKTLSPLRFEKWVKHLFEIERVKQEKAEIALNNPEIPIHPLRLCKEIRDFMDRDAILVVDGQEILNFGRQSIPSYEPRSRLNSGPFGTMGVGLPFGIGAKVARPDKQVIVLHGDGSFGMNGMELDTAVRHNIPVITVISLNGGWTADPDRIKPGVDLGYTRYDKMAESLGCYAEYVEHPDEIRPALERAKQSGRPALINIKTDWRAEASTYKFTRYET